MIGIINYGLGNVQAFYNLYKSIDVNVKIIEHKDKVELMICNNAAIELSDSPISFVRVETCRDVFFSKWYSYSWLRIFKKANDDN